VSAHFLTYEEEEKRAEREERRAEREARSGRQSGMRN